jgi:hypothetical protein
MKILSPDWFKVYEFLKIGNKIALKMKSLNHHVFSEDL